MDIILYLLLGAVVGALVVYLLMRAQRSTLTAQLSTLNTQLSTLTAQHSTLNAQHSTLNTQHSALTTQLSTLTAERAALQKEVDMLKEQHEGESRLRQEQFAEQSDPRTTQQGQQREHGAADETHQG